MSMFKSIILKVSYFIGVAVLLLPVLLVFLVYKLTIKFTKDDNLSPYTCQEKTRIIVEKYSPIIVKYLKIDMPGVYVKPVYVDCFGRPDNSTLGFFSNAYSNKIYTFNELKDVITVFKPTIEGDDYMRHHKAIFIFSYTIASRSKCSWLLFKLKVISTLAHELRHVWQYNNLDRSSFAPYIRAEDDFLAYKKQDIEKDADRFSIIFIIRLILNKIFRIKL